MCESILRKGAGMRDRDGDLCVCASGVGELGERGVNQTQ